MIKICVECGSAYESITNSLTCSEKCKSDRQRRKRKEFPSRKSKSFIETISEDYCEGEKVVVHRDVRENNEKVKHKEIAKVVKIYPYFVLCEIKLRNRKCLESFKFDEVKRLYN